MTRPSFLQRARPERAFAYSTLAFAAALALAAGEANAFDVDTGNPDVAVRWDNTVRDNYAHRVEARDSKIGNSALADEGDYSFDKGQTVSKRLDLLSEFDLDLQEALRLPRERHGLVRRRLRRHQPSPTPTRRCPASRATSTTSTARGQAPVPRTAAS